MHRLHHERPWQPKLTLLPPVVPITLAPLVLIIGWILLPETALALTLLGALATMALIYEWTHFIVHTRIQPKSRYGKAVFLNHRMHHFRHDQRWFSFTLPAIDRWLGTGPDYRDTPRSQRYSVTKPGKSQRLAVK